MKKFLTAVLAAVLTLTAGFSVFAASSDSFAIEYDSTTDMHYIPASVAQQANAGDRFLIYCMNNKLHWPHTTPSISSVPDYTEGYLTASDFKSTDEYNTFISRLMTILYAGYPYNGFGLYQIVANPTSIGEAEFNQMLAVPSVLRTDFADVLGDTQFTYSDYTNHNTENLNKLSAFLTAVGDYYPSSTNTTHLKTPSGLTYQDITALPFYKAALCIYYANGQTPLEAYAQAYANSYYVTEKQAYQATQRAVWRLMNEYGIPDNNLTASSQAYTDYPLAGILYQASDANSKILRTEPSSEKISISGDATLNYDENTKQWVSGDLMVSEPTNYNGSYQLSVEGDGVSIQTANGGTTVKAGETFKLVSDKQVSGRVTATAADKVWLKSMQMYSPVGREDFQHMVGAVMGKKTISTAKAFNSTPKKEESTTTDPKDPEGSKTEDPSKPTTEDPKHTTTEDSNKSTTKTQSKLTTQASPVQKKIEGKSITAVLTGDDTNWTQYADWMALAALVGAAAIIIRKKTSAK
ncbi:Cys-Gln thioester bond-forming surface protein [Pseudoramibacter porci]|uniref:Thioester domain-containing protein n=1 Tax=Pseudoramibacter porci TaxID=2606631 RepID=A0A7X2TA94_9FIRM|nr:Cys-Gln thioester bond-forming surface protein [Pseudoramibacter porci]MSS19256.1 hypothetical protein [Pseudoramibacter porci]